VKKKTGRACIVCGRLEGRSCVIDGVTCIACPECEGDRFRRPYAVKWTVEGKPER